MTFQPYTFQQLQEIVHSRLIGIGAFDPDAVQLASRKVPHFVMSIITCHYQSCVECSRLLLLLTLENFSYDWCTRRWQSLHYHFCDPKTNAYNILTSVTMLFKNSHDISCPDIGKQALLWNMSPYVITLFSFTYWVLLQVAAVSGDARRALDICRRSTEVAEAKGVSQVNMMHVDCVLQEMFSSPKIAAIR